MRDPFYVLIAFIMAALVLAAVAVFIWGANAQSECSHYTGPPTGWHCK